MAGVDPGPGIPGMTDALRIDGGVRLPRRHQCKRVKGWRKPEGAIYVTRPGIFGNPFPVDIYGQPVAAELHRQWLANTPQGRRIIADLMVWGNVYSPIEESDPTKLALAVGENNFAKRVAYYLGFKADHYQYAQRAIDDTDVINQMLRNGSVN